MLVYSRKRLLPAEINTLVLEDMYHNYVYLHRQVYDQAVVVSYRYNDNIDGLKSLLGVDAGSVEPPAVTKFFTEAPKPVNILAYLLYLVKGIEDWDEELEVLYGTLSVITSGTDFRKILAVPKSVRADINFSVYIKDEYQLTWDRFFQSAIPYGTVPVVKDEDEEDGELVSTFGADVAAQLMSSTSFDFLTEDFGSPVEKEPEPVVQDVAPVANPEPETNKSKSGLSLLKGL